MIRTNRYFLALALALSLGACGGRLVSPTERVLHHVAGAPAYVNAEVFKTSAFQPPPAPGSEAQKADLAAVLDWQQKRTAADCARSQATADADYDFFWGDKPLFPSPLPPEVKEFFKRLDYDAGEAINNMKNRYARLRPFKGYPAEVLPCIKKSKGYSYPSGHASYSRIFVDVLGDIAPERKEEFVKRADEMAADRVVGGVHYPTDIAAGKAFGDDFHARLLQSPAYLKDVERMKTLLLK
jgi:acid phosphatase (class A)